VQIEVVICILHTVRTAGMWWKTQ